MIKPIRKWNFKDLRQALRHLGQKERMLILEDLQQDLYAQRLRKISDILRSKARTTSFRKISRITQKVRQKLHDA